MKRLTALSGFGTKGPACFLLELGGRRLLLDLGAGPDHDRRPDLAGIAPVDAILISHGHPDHVGALDLADGLGDPPVFATAPVRRLAGAARLAAAHDLPIAGRIELFGIAIETGPAGHAPGAVWMRIGGPAGLLYTGDCSDESLLYPFQPPLPARVAVVDASYATATGTLDAQREALLDLARRSVPLLLPAPAAGRGLEMALALAAAGHAVALCPAHRRVAADLLAHPETLSMARAGDLASLLAAAHPLDDPTTPLRDTVMIAAGADAAGGLSAPLARQMAGAGLGTIAFTGHLSAGTPAETLVASGRAVWSRWNVHPPLAGLKALLAAIAPDIVLPAFCPAEDLRALAAALPGHALAQSPEIRW